MSLVVTQFQLCLWLLKVFCTS